MPQFETDVNCGKDCRQETNAGNSEFEVNIELLHLVEHKRGRGNERSKSSDYCGVVRHETFSIRTQLPEEISFAVAVTPATFFAN